MLPGHPDTNPGVLAVWFYFKESGLWQLVRSHFWAWDILFSFVEDLKREVFVELSVNLAAPLRGQIWVLVAERM